jgi:hypothetical protein
MPHGGIRIRNNKKRAAADPRLRPRGPENRRSVTLLEDNAFKMFQSSILRRHLDLGEKKERKKENAQQALS